MRRYLAATAIALLGTVLTGTGSAATTARAPTPHCGPWWDPILTCTCPPGWHVAWPPAWEFWKSGIPYCAPNKKK